MEDLHNKNEPVLPFEELDSCCQREIIDSRKNAEVKDRLRQTDRSNVRLDMKADIMNSLRFHNKGCHCCVERTDYELLTNARAAMQLQLSENDVNSVEREDESDESDDDFGGLDDGDFVSEYELGLRRAAQEAEANIAQMASMGVGVHINESIEHLDDIILREDVVCHICDPSYQACAELDIILENIAKDYLGTKFRRVFYSQAVRDHFLTKYKVPINDCHERSALVCFHDGYPGAMAMDVSRQFGRSHVDSLEPSEVLKFLDMANVLQKEMVLSTLRHTGDESDSELEEEETFQCGVVGCCKDYYHEHVTGTSALLNSESNREAGAEVLDTGIFHKL